MKQQHKIIASASIALLLMLILWSARWGLADIYAYQAQRHLDQWQQQKKVESGNITQALHWIEKARLLDLNNPRLIEHQAQIFQWKATSTQDQDLRKNDLEQAAQLYRNSLALRPTWPYAWVALLSVKSQLGQFDEEFSKALERCMHFASWESSVQQQIIIMGFKHWSELTSKEQDLIQASYARSLHGTKYLNTLIQIGIEHDQFELFCFNANMGKEYNTLVQFYCRRSVLKK